MIPFTGLKRALRFLALPLVGTAALVPFTATGVEYQTLNAFTSPPSIPSSGLLALPDGSFYGLSAQGGAYQHGCVFRIVQGAVTVMASFDGPSTGDHPLGGLVKGTDGNFYGVTSAGGASGHGTFFQLTPQGALTAHPFQLNSLSVPMSGLVQAADGYFYGMATRGPFSGAVLYKATLAGVVSPVVEFDFQEGSTSTQPLSIGTDGNFYGTTSDGGGAGNYGTAFKVTPAGGYTRLADFRNFTGRHPDSGLTLAADGNFYGTTQTAPGGGGTVFRLTPDGDLSLVATLTYTQGIGPSHRMLADADGYLYGTTYGTFSKAPTLFRVKPGFPLEKLADLTPALGGEPAGGLVVGYDNSIYGIGISGVHVQGTIFRWMRVGLCQAQANFANAGGDFPISAMVLAPDGFLYGSTARGGRSDAGTMFRALPEGDLFHLADFSPTIGSYPSGPLTLGVDGGIYGTTEGGGNFGGGGGVYCYPKSSMINPAAGGIAPVISIGNGDNGFKPLGGVVTDDAGNLYGSTFSGILESIVFKITPDYQHTTLANLGAISGAYCFGRLVRDPAGNLYGVMRDGGTHDAGIIYRVAPDGTVTKLADFNPANGSRPCAGLMLDGSGNLWGTTLNGGPTDKGSVFQLAPDGTLTTFVQFDGPNGAYPQAGLTTGPDGNFYGTTSAGGSWDFGTVFRITPAGVFTKLQDLDYLHGAGPKSELSQGPAGQLYGVTSSGGMNADGVLTGGGQLFRLQFGPTVTTLEGQDDSATSITLHGRVDPNGCETSVEFHYLPAASSEPFVNPIRIILPTIPADAGPTEVSYKLTGLTPNGYYDFRIVASNAENPLVQEGKIVRANAGGVDPNAGPDQFLFTALDTNQNNLLTLDEWRLIYVSAQRKEVHFQKVDSDHDGNLQYIEFSAAPDYSDVVKTYDAALQRTKTFLEVDSSGDNLITKVEIAKMWQPGTSVRTIDAWWSRAGPGATIDFYEWLHLKTLPSLTNYELAKLARAQRSDAANRLDTDLNGAISFNEFTHLFQSSAKPQAIDIAWRTANATPRGTASPISMTKDAFVEAARLPKLTIY